MPLSDTVYIQPIGLAASPQSEEGDCIRLAGGMVYAHRFVVLVKRDGDIVERWRATRDTIDDVMARLPDELAADAEAQWTNLTLAHPPLELGGRTVRLDQPQVMGILNVTPDSFSDGGQFLDNPEAGRQHAAAMLEAGAALVDIGGDVVGQVIGGAGTGRDGDRVFEIAVILVVIGRNRESHGELYAGAEW